MTSLPPLPPYFTLNTQTPTQQRKPSDTNLASLLWMSLSFCCIWLFSSITLWASFGQHTQKNLLYHQWFTKVITLLFQILIRWWDFFFSLCKTTQPWSFNVQLQSSLWHHSYHSIRVSFFVSYSFEKTPFRDWRNLASVSWIFAFVQQQKSLYCTTTSGRVKCCFRSL